MTQLMLALDEYVAFDLETTGLSAWGGDEIVEIGAMKIYGDEVDEKNVFHSLVNPRRPIGPDATRVHGITDEMVANAPVLEDVLPQFLEYVGGSYLVAQNAKFDMSFLTKSMVTYKLSGDLEVYDTLVFSRRAFPNEGRHNLDVIVERLGLKIAPAERHRSLGDVRVTAQAFIALRQKLGSNSPASERWTV